VQATAENAAHNQVGDKIAAAITPLGELGSEVFPLVLANIQAHVLRALKADLIARTGETLILSGLLTPQAQPGADEFVAEGLRLVEIRLSTDDPQWSSVQLART
jgi:ribosomal protein L11 methylase PrmA